MDVGFGKGARHNSGITCLAPLSYGPGNELLCLTHHFNAMEPDIVIMAVYTGNDLSDVFRLYKRVVNKEVLGQVEDSDAKEEPASAEMERKRHHVKSIWPRLKNINYWTDSSKISTLIYPSLRHLAVELGWLDPKMVYNMFLIRSCAISPNKDIEWAIKLIEMATDEANLFCRDRGTRFMVLIIPPLFLVDRAMFDRFYDTYPDIDRDEHSPDVLHERLRSIFRAKDVPCLDLLPLLRDRHAQGLKLYHDEGHWNAAGHQEAADWIFNFLKSKNWL